VVSTRAQQRRRTARRSTRAGVLGIALMVLGIALTLAHVGGNALPTALALVGLALLIVGIATGSLLVLNNFRYRSDQSYYDPDEEDDGDR
jgi:small-conductance mechanosensitive channel